jgi:hypothetical protein
LAFLLGITLLAPSLITLVFRRPCFLSRTALKEFAKSPPKRGLILLVGDSFRGSVEAQEIASYSHTKFMKHVQTSYNFLLDVVISTYDHENGNTEKLLQLYNSSNVIHSIFHKLPAIGLQNLMNNATDSVNLDGYAFLMGIRLDIFLKPYLTEIFDPGAGKVMFPSICFVINNYHKAENGWPRVSDTLIFVPGKFIRKPIFISHGGWVEWVQNHKLNLSDIMPFVKTYHDSDSIKDWNPLYYMTGRPCTASWYSKGLEFDPATMEPKSSTITYKEYESQDHITTGDIKCVLHPDIPSPAIREIQKNMENNG